MSRINGSIPIPQLPFPARRHLGGRRWYRPFPISLRDLRPMFAGQGVTVEPVTEPADASAKTLEPTDDGALFQFTGDGTEIELNKLIAQLRCRI